MCTDLQSEIILSEQEVYMCAFGWGFAHYFITISTQTISGMTCHLLKHLMHFSFNLPLVQSWPYMSQRALLTYFL